MSEKKKKTLPTRTVADNRRARFDYEIGETFEAGIMLKGTEVKALRTGKATIHESYAAGKNGELWLYNSYIPEYLEANRFNHEPRRPRKLLMHKRQIHKLTVAVEREGMTIVAMKVYFNEDGRAKVEVALGKGRKAHDKREAVKERDWNRDKARLMRDRG
ncbi:SsrA-binding protein [Azorhizobium oxalatiphilum]|uniref:SsrA-binding protein n=1 Tax=Azorhizobium oxalatiphilum TaxID=980631 RepID=A0A917FG19_9HYPH|nr:SsrA-binding protein SmpB [Azorhizobium oxalatiphilum]GGF74298.1 SsrA-binding protein [Azorhizobium oxalatiphilum]